MPLSTAEVTDEATLLYGVVPMDFLYEVSARTKTACGERFGWCRLIKRSISQVAWSTAVDGGNKWNDALVPIGVQDHGYNVVIEAYHGTSQGWSFKSKLSGCLLGL